MTDWSWVHELPLAAGAPWPAMGVRGDDRPWPDPVGAPPRPDMAERREILDAHRREVVGAVAGSEAAVAEVLERTGTGELGDAAVVSGDDLCLLDPRSGALVAGAVLWPSHWRLTDHLGHSLAAVHGRVPGYAGVVETQVDRFVERLVPGGRAVRRANVLWHALPDRFSPRPPPSSVRGAVAPADWWLRSEHQTLRRLPSSGAVLFTFRTRQVRLGALLAGEPALAPALAAHLRALGAERAAYAGIAADRARVAAWLEAGGR